MARDWTVRSMQRGVDTVKVFGGQEGKDPHTYFEPQHLLGLFRFQFHHAHCSELGVLRELIQIFRSRPAVFLTP
ncbi:hypothetical protein EMIT0P100_10649 [Pseudomonas sp. IT-P100]